MLPNVQETVDLVTFAEEILNGKLHFFEQCINKVRWVLKPRPITNQIHWEKEN